MTPHARFIFVLFAVLLLFAAGAAFAQPVNPDVTPETIKSTICVHGWTKTVRPPVTYTNRVKREEMENAGIPWERAREIELDHRVPLALGGAPAAPENLWLQTWAPAAPDGWKVDANARAKDHLEVRLRNLVCAGELDLREAQRCIYDDWRACAALHPAK
jgi:hypothetical protein